MSYLRATRPLDPAAVAAANDAIASETGGRRLGMGPEDADYRRKWMEAYQAAGGGVEVVDPDAHRDHGSPCEKCKCQPISSIALQSVAFTSDHDLLKNEVAQWTNTGHPYHRPEWHVGHPPSPISHTMDLEVALTVTLRVEPPNACPETGRLVGEGPDGLRFEREGVNFKPGLVKVSLRSTGKLARRVQKLDLALTWTAEAPSVTGGGTSKNDCYVTMDRPIIGTDQEDGVTLKRMEKAVEHVGAASSLDPHTIVAHLMALLPEYTLKTNPAVPTRFKHPEYFNAVGGAWPIADHLPQVAECQAIVRFVRGVIRQVGCPGDAKTVVVWSDPDVGGGATVLEANFGVETLHSRKKRVGGKDWYPVLADRDPVAVGQRFTEDTMGINAYEACLKFDHGGVKKYYGGGAGIYDTKEQVITAFYALIWISYEVDAAGNEVYVVEEIVKRYR